MDLHDVGEYGGLGALGLWLVEKGLDLYRDRGKKVESTEKQLEEKKDERTAALERKFDAFGDRFTAAFEKLGDKIGDLQRDLGGSVAKLQAQVAVLESQLRTLELTVGRLTDEKHELAQQLNTLILQGKSAP